MGLKLGAHGSGGCSHRRRQRVTLGKGVAARGMADAEEEPQPREEHGAPLRLVGELQLPIPVLHEGQRQNLGWERRDAILVALLRRGQSIKIFPES